MKAATWFIAITAIAFSAWQPANAGHYGRRYEIAPVSFSQERGSAGKILVLDQRTGALWTWSENEGTAYAGMLAVNQAGSFARIIEVSR